MQALINECLELDFPELGRRMCQSGHAAGAADQADGPIAFQPHFVDARRASVSKKACKNLASTGHLARSHQVIGEVTAPQDCAREDTPNRLVIDREPQRLQSFYHVVESLGPAVAQRCHGGTKRRVVISYEIPQDMDLAIVLLAGQFDSGY
jgi:hypothetical protein